MLVGVPTMVRVPFCPSGKLLRGGRSIPGTLHLMFSLAVLLCGLIISTIYVFCPDHWFPVNFNFSKADIQFWHPRAPPTPFTSSVRV